MNAAMRLAEAMRSLTNAAYSEMREAIQRQAQPTDEGWKLIEAVNSWYAIKIDSALAAFDAHAGAEEERAPFGSCPKCGRGCHVNDPIRDYTFWFKACDGCACAACESCAKRESRR
jgi:predicted  nucleic acid-binding Zn ribbon protein